MQLGWALVGRIVAATAFATPCNLGAGESKVGTATITAEDVVVVCSATSCSSHVDKLDVGNFDAICGFASWAAVEVILLNINAVFADIRKSDILVGDVVNLVFVSAYVSFSSHIFLTYCPSSIRVGLDSGAILTVDNLGIAECYPIDSIVALSTNGAYAEAVTSIALKPGDCHTAA
jgi:hypothetical protein